MFYWTGVLVWVLMALVFLTFVTLGVIALLRVFSLMRFLAHLKREHGITKIYANFGVWFLGTWWTMLWLGPYKQDIATYSGRGGEWRDVGDWDVFPHIDETLVNKEW